MSVRYFLAPLYNIPQGTIEPAATLKRDFLFLTAAFEYFLIISETEYFIINQPSIKSCKDFTHFL